MKLFSSLKLQKGFTLIELLVVIGILGILAAALVATIDPFEQLKKAEDTRVKNMALEYQKALVRYYSTHGSFPWNDLASDNANCTALGSAAFTGATINLNTASMLSCINGATFSLQDEGELKDSFDNNTTDLAKVKVSWDPNDPSDAIVCFAPTSKSQKAAPDADFDAAGAAQGATCPDADAAAGVCHWCAQ